MFIAYFDESGDDGYPAYSSRFFILTSVYLHHEVWKENLRRIQEFRRLLRNDYGIPIPTEFHCAALLEDKDPYHHLGLAAPDRKQILELFVRLIAQLDLKIINVVIGKANITTPEYAVLENALKYNIQRIENDLTKSRPEAKFLMIVDEGRLGPMRTIARKVQRITFIPTKFNPFGYRSEIKTLIEDPLVKSSDQSYFLQMADTVSYVVNLYALRKFGPDLKWANRVMRVLTHGDELRFLGILRDAGRLNVAASGQNDYGIVYYPTAK